MKKLIYILSLGITLLCADIDIMKVSDTLSNIYGVKYYNNDKSILLDSTVPTTTLKKADIVLFPAGLDINKITIVNSYAKLRLEEKSIGAIYTFKNRTQIIFVRERLKKNSLSLSKELNQYIINECQLNLICLANHYKIADVF